MFKIVFVIIGTLIGAGFASGREIYLFFGKFGTLGILGIIISSFLSAVIIYRVLVITKTYEITNYNKLLNRINWKHPSLNKLFNFIINSFLVVSFYIMVAGFSSYFSSIFDIHVIICAIIFSSICFIVLKRDIKGVLKIDELLVPALVVFLVVLGIKNIPYLINNIGSIKINLSNISSNSFNWIFNSILYASYNSILLIPILTSIRDYLYSKKQIILISVISMCIILILSLFIYSLILKDYYFISQQEMPLSYVVSDFGRSYKLIYGFIIIVSIFTTAISSGHSFIKNVDKSKYSMVPIIFILCTSSVFISTIGFSNLVGFLYPLFGILGLLQIFLLFKKTP